MAVGAGLAVGGGGGGGGGDDLVTVLEELLAVLLTAGLELFFVLPDFFLLCLLDFALLSTIQ